MAEYTFECYIEELKKLFASMKESDVSVSSFPFTYKNISVDAIFDTSSSTNGWMLVFLKETDPKRIYIPIEKGYRLSIKGNEQYGRFKEFFKISSKKGEFKISEFVARLKEQIPDNYTVTSETRRAYLKYIDDEEGEYPVSVKDWGKYHIRNPKAPNDKYHRTDENLLKTRNCYPEIYRVIKDKDISIVYGKTPDKSIKEIISKIEE